MTRRVRTGQVASVVVGSWLVGLAAANSAAGAIYDFSSGAGILHFGYGESVTLPMPPVSSTFPSSAYSAASLAAAATSNDVRLSTDIVENPGNTLVATQRFVFTISEPAATVSRLDVRWEGGASEDGFEYLWLWNAVSGAYVQIGSQENFKLPNEGTILASVTAQPGDFVDANNRVTILVNYFEGGASISTDYVSLTVAGAACGTDAECDDGLFCNGAETCVTGTCRAGTAVNCNDANACTTDACNEVTRVCDHLPVNCDDGLYCNGVETCNAVLGCRPGAAINCNDSNACTVDACNETTDACNHAPVNCSNGLYCDGVETCDPALGCRAGTPVNCTDADPCTNDSCNETTDTCDHAPRVPPAAATAPSPPDGAIEVAAAPALSWTGSASDANCPRVFDLYLDAVNPPGALVASGLTAAGYSSAPLAAATTYYWRVVTRDCCTQSAGVVWSFTTAGTPTLGANPASLTFTLPTGQQQQQQVTITNSGNAPTSWSAVESVAGAAAILAPPTPAPQRVATQGQPRVDWTAERHPTTLLVGFKNNVATKRNVAMAQRDAVHALRRTTKVRSFVTIPVDVVDVPAGADLKTVAAQYAAMPEVEFVEPNYLYHTNGIPNDASFGSLWGMHNTGQTGGVADADIDAPEAWDLATGSATVVVGVIDTGIDYTHPELAPNMWTNSAERNGVAGIDDDGNGIIDDVYGARWTSGTGVPTNGNPYDDHYHGTHVAGTIGAVGNNGLGVAGVNWNVRMMALKFLNSAGSGYLADAVSAIDYARLMGANLTSNSWGGGGYSLALKSAIEAAGAAGQLFIAAAGNSGVNADLYPMYPAAYDSPTIVSVAATDHSDLLAYFSNYGAASVDLGAPGVNVWSTGPGNTYRSLSGTSMATPHVSGVAALLLATRPTMPPLELKQMLMASVDPVPALSGRCVTGGRLNAHRAVLLSDPAQWLSFTPASGVLWPGESAILTVSASAAGLAPGSVFNAVIQVSSGDPAGPLGIPVSLNVASCTTDTDCDDGLVCDGPETCGPQGTCQPGAAVNCGDGVACTTDSCVEPTGACTHTPSDALCDNGLVCDGTETCNAAAGCQAGTPVVCDDGVPCTMDQCSEAFAGCDFIPNDAACDNGLFCDGYEYCDFFLGCQPGYYDPCFGQPCDEATDTCGTCGTDADCDDGVPCTTDSCDTATGTCNNLPDDLLCDDGLFCNGWEYCDSWLGCVSTGDPCFGLPCNEATDSCGGCLSDADCDDFVPCTVDSCDPNSGFCNHTPDHTACDNGLFCDGVETCDALRDCVAGTPIDCADAIVCTLDLCNEATDTCDHTPDDTSCDNGLYCDGSETCDALLDCRAGTPVNCDDFVGCTVDSCNEATRACDHLPNHSGCDDGLFCNGTEVCHATLGCQAGAPVTCDDGIPCTVDACNEVTDACAHAPDDLACDDGLFCNGVESCDAVAGCAAGTAPCAPGDTCDEATDACVPAAAAPVWMCFQEAALIPGIGNVENEDIVAYDTLTGTWSLVFDGSDVGITALGIDGLAVLPDGDLLLSFWNNTGTVPGLVGGPNGTSVDDSDIVRFTPSSLGADTAGVFTFYFDGSDVGLTTDNEDVDAITLAPDGRLIVSTFGGFGVTGLSGQDEDLLVFNAASLGSVTAGTFAMYFDGSDVGLSTTAGEDVDAAAVTAAGTILLSTEGNFAVTGVGGADEDVFEFTPATLGGVTTGSYTMLLDLSALGIDPLEDVAAVEVPR
ncbi:MAG: S8 family serine peptidase [Planctomycetes bacterium]|nr:S8 family serine peptidase [Planctomycetota bacterium]